SRLVLPESPDTAYSDPRDAVLGKAEICYVPKYSFAERVIALEPPEQQHEELLERYVSLAYFVQRFGEALRRSRRSPASVPSTAEPHVFVSYRREDRTAALGLRD